MSDKLGYNNKNVVVTGAAAGMGAATAEKLTALGANVYALDIADISAPVAHKMQVDMKDFSAIDNALAQLPDTVHALFNCAGVPSPPFAAQETILINFSGLRYLTELLVPRMPRGSAIASIASTAGMGWRANTEILKAFLSIDNSYGSATQWIADHPDATAEGYGFSKQAIIVYTMLQAKTLAQQGIRINCISPSPTASGFMDKLKGEGQLPDEAIALFLPSIGEYATGADMADPLILLNSDMAGFVSGINVPVDFGYCAEVYMGQRDDLMGIA